MSDLAIAVGADNISKFHLERALLAYSTKKPEGYLEKCNKLNNFLNAIVEKEIRTGVYNDHIKLPPGMYDEIFKNRCVD